MPQDWFAQHAPTKAAAPAAHDWFSANAPQASPDLPPNAGLAGVAPPTIAGDMRQVNRLTGSPDLLSEDEKARLTPVIEHQLSDYYQNDPVGRYAMGTVANTSQGAIDLAHGKIAKGGHEVITGVGTGLSPLIVPAAAIAPGAVAKAVAKGYIGSKVAGGIASFLGLPEDEQQFASDLGGIAGAGSGQQNREFAFKTAPRMAGSAVRGAGDLLSNLRSAVMDIFTRPRPVGLGEGEVIPPNVRTPGQVEPERVGQQQTDENILAGRQGVRIPQPKQLNAAPQQRIAGQLPSLTESTRQLPEQPDSEIAAFLQGRSIEQTRPGADIRAFLEANPNASPGAIRAAALSAFDQAGPQDMGGLGEGFDAQAPRPGRIVKRQPAEPAREIPGNGEIQPGPQSTFPGIGNGYSAAAYSLSHENLATLETMARRRGVPFVKGGDTHASLIGKLVDSLTPSEITELEAAAMERSLHPSPRPEMRNYNAQQATQRAQQSSSGIEDLLRGSLAQQGVEIPPELQATPPEPPAEEPTAIEQMFNPDTRTNEQMAADRARKVQAEGIIQRAGLRPENVNRELGTVTFSDPTSRSMKMANMGLDELLQGGPEAAKARMQEVLSQPEPPRAGQGQPKPGVASVAPVSAAALKPGQAGLVPLKDLSVDAKRFQFKANTDEAGVSNLLKDTKTFNPDLAGVVSVWTDPADGHTYIVNGHHRFELAQRTGQENLLVRKLNVPTAEAARARGALINISEGRGTAVDAAKFFRDSGMGPQDLERAGVSLAEGKVQAGLALSKLDPSIFEQVATGRMSEGRGIAIGEQTSDPAEQEAIVKLITKAENRGKTVTNATVSELARFVRNSSRRVEHNEDLFGPRAEVYSNAVEKAEISAYVKGQLAREKRIFGAVADHGKAEILGRVKDQSIRPGENAKISQAAAQALEVFDKLSSYKGPVDQILDNAAKELNLGYDKPEAIKQKAYRLIRDEIQTAIPGGEGGGDSGRDSGTSAGKGPQAKAKKSIVPFLGDAGDFNA